MEIVIRPKKINDYICQKAEVQYGGRTWEAWYTSEIPITEGPYKFYSLPGLILEITSKDGDYHFIMKSFTKEKIVWALPKSLSINEGNLENLTKRVIEDPSYRSRQIDNNSNFKVKAYFNGKELKNDNASYQRHNQKYWYWLKNHNNPLDKTEIWVK